MSKPGSKAGGKAFIRNYLGQFALVIELVIIFLVFSVLTNGLFLSSLNLSNLLVQGCTFSILGIGMLWLMVAGGIDLSAGSVLGFLANFAAVVETSGKVGTPMTIVFTLILGIIIGCWNGYWIAYRKIPAFIATLAGQLIFRGLMLLVGGGKAQGPVSAQFSLVGREFMAAPVSIGFAAVMIVLVVVFSLRSRGSKKKHGLPVPSLLKEVLRLVLICGVIVALTAILVNYRGIPYAIVLLLALAVIATFVSNNTPFGRSIYALGGNREAAKLSGISIPRVEFSIYALMGLITAIASVVFLGRIGQATATVGNGFEFSAITGCIVGGTSTLGGSGTVFGAIIGTMLMAGIDNGMSLMNLDATYQFIVKGLVLLVAVSIDISSKSKKD